MKGALNRALFFTSILIMDNKNEPTQGQLNIELSEEMADGTYSNLAIITHSPSEFVVDFINIMPNVPKAKVRSRIILTPEHAKRMMKALNENIRKYESMHGPIVDRETPPLPMNFGMPTTQA